ncbi:MAG: hypothetical protein JNG86_18435 [Verrucomicrobiaceae bacterium]|nr:hypothetical protein [Verrucomicrobiaceae bacterium]
MADVILDQVHDFDAKHGISSQLAVPGSRLNESLAAWLTHGRDQIGEIAISTRNDGSYSLRHASDHDRADLTPFHGAEEARELARYDDSGSFRPLHSAPTLKRGWELHLTSLDELRLALDFFYPAAIRCAQALEQETITSTPLRDFLGRQTGMYRFTNTISDAQAFDMVAKTCASTKCQRRILWPLTPDQPLPPDETKSQPDAIPLLCIEACPRIVSAARKIAKETHEAREAARMAST